jgi:beta-phosphoglucomutase-like phosphatase (HAD superfamily)/dTDP-glucose pyrophosphorylase
MHYDALNLALANVGKEYVINKEEHLSLYDGLPTSKKLTMLTEKKGLPVDKHQQIWEDKQSATLDIFSKLENDYELMHYFKQLKSHGYNIAVASNSIRNTVKIVLLKLGILEFIDYYVSNEDVNRNKPFPEMYWKCMTACNAIPKNTVIFEDSHIGRQGAIDSGSTLIAIENRYDLNQEKINKVFKILSEKKLTIVPWKSEKMNVLIPMAGAGSRFASAGYTFPKPLIEVNGKPMIQVVIENLNIEANYTFVVRKEHYEKYSLQYLLTLIAPNCNIIQVDSLTEGSACTTLLAKEFINNDYPLLLANSDQFMQWNSNESLYAFNADGIDAGILTFKATHPKWSYAKIGEDGFVSEVAEKKPISDNATVGVYYWNKGSDYVKYAEQMIEKNIRTNNEFYICPVFNEAIADGKKIRIKEIERMWGIGTPEDLNYFLEHYKE